MQSQQKKVKWSRGETASALEERTDTGITEVSVARMENCMADIYGNISRRPALKLIPLASDVSAYGLFSYKKKPRIFPFYIAENDVILVKIGGTSNSKIVGFRIKNGVMVSYAESSNSLPPIPDEAHYSFAQQNNYAILACKSWSANITISLFSDNQFGINAYPFVFTGGWYAPSGVRTEAVTANNISGLQFNKDGLGFTPYTFTDRNGESTVFYAIDTGLGIDKEEDVREAFPIGSIIQFPKNGAYLRVEGFATTPSNDGQTRQLLFPDIVFDGVINSNQSIPSVGYYVRSAKGSLAGGSIYITRYSNGQQVGKTIIEKNAVIVRNKASSTGFSITNLLTGDWSELVPTGITIMVYGALLTPVANSEAKDETVNVETGYVSLTQEQGADLPTPSKICFCDQRLWAGGWKIQSEEDQYALVIGSQIAKYTDFKNDYNLGNEAITLDILTKYKEDILHLIDYNGLKIFTTGAEWAYSGEGCIKQSANGSLATCEPIVFGPLCLYADQTGGQIRAMEYEFQSNIFNSTVINQMTPGDLIWQPIAMAQYEDKTNNTGRHLFVINQPDNTHPSIATCNFVPGNQATIWSRWTGQTLTNTTAGDWPIIQGVVNTRNFPIFIISAVWETSSGYEPVFLFATLDYEGEADFMMPIDSRGYWFLNEKLVRMPNTNVAVYRNGQFLYESTIDSNGKLVDMPSNLTGITVGMPINARVVSHPIDVGGKTKTITKRIAKAVMSVRNTEPGAVTINNKTGYMNPAKDMINFYGVTGMKREIIYTITNNKGAKFTIESLTMNIEYGTLIS